MTRKKGGAKKAPSAKQRANWARFAAMAKSRRSSSGGGPSIRSNRRGTSAPLKSTFLGGVTKRFDWLEAVLFGFFGYYLAPTLSNLGVGWMLYDNIPIYKQAIDSADQATNKTGGPNMWGAGGLYGVSKLTGVGLMAFLAQHAARGKQLSKGHLSVVAPMAVGMMLDPPSNGGDYGGGHSSSSVNYSVGKGMNW